MLISTYHLSSCTIDCNFYWLRCFIDFSWPLFLDFFSAYMLDYVHVVFTLYAGFVHIVCTLCLYCVHIVFILCAYCLHTICIMLAYWPISFTCFLDIVCILCAYRAISCTCLLHIVYILCAYCVCVAKLNPCHLGAPRAKNCSLTYGMPF